MLTKIFETKQNKSRVSFACLKTEICCLKAVFSPRKVHILEFSRIWGNLPAWRETIHFLEGSLRFVRPALACSVFSLDFVLVP